MHAPPQDIERRGERERGVLGQGQGKLCNASLLKFQGKMFGEFLCPDYPGILHPVFFILPWYHLTITHSLYTDRIDNKQSDTTTLYDTA